MLSNPINFTKWVAENKDKLQPPVNNFLLFKGQDTIIMVVGGPNQRTDYHINETEVLVLFYNIILRLMLLSSINSKFRSILFLCFQEWFYQVEGNLLIKVVDDGEFRDIHVNEGEMFLLPRKLYKHK
jgi:3-hydroxyanthranilate 3,4-dioxygenase